MLKRKSNEAKAIIILENPHFFIIAPFQEAANNFQHPLLQFLVFYAQPKANQPPSHMMHHHITLTQQSNFT